jgi:hypothetical protein
VSQSSQPKYTHRHQNPVTCKRLCFLLDVWTQGYLVTWYQLLVLFSTEIMVQWTWWNWVGSDHVPFQGAAPAFGWGVETNLSQVLIVQHLVKSSQCYHMSHLAVYLCMVLNVKILLLFTDIPHCCWISRYGSSRWCKLSKYVRCSVTANIVVAYLWKHRMAQHQYCI